MTLFPIQLLILLVLMNRYLVGPLVRRLQGKRGDPVDDSYQPTVAVIVPLYNEGEGIFHTVRSLLEQEYPADRFQIVVVDDCSKDDSYAWACKAAEGHANVTVMRNPENMGKRKGIARAVRAVEAEIIVSVDSDVVADKRAVKELVRRFTAPDIAAVGGRTFIVNRHASWLTQMLEVKFHFSQVWLKDLERTCDTVMCLTGCLTAYRRTVLLELDPILEDRNIAGVPIKYGEDRFLTRMIVKHGYRTRSTIAAFCQTAAPKDIQGYYSQQLRWRRSNLVDMICGLSHAWKLPAPVGIHYVAQFCLLLAYPVVILENLMAGEFFSVLVKHAALIAVMGLVYRWEVRHLPDELKVPAHALLPITFLMPVTYAFFTPLALATLDSGSWETRNGPATAAAPAGVPPPPGGGPTPVQLNA